MERDPYLGTSSVAIEPGKSIAELDSATEESDEVPGLFLIEVLTVFACRKRLIVLAAGIATVAGAILSLLLPPEYTASGRIMPPQQTQSTSAMLMNQLAGGASGLIQSSGGGLLGLKNPGEIYIGMLGSRTISDAIVKDFDLQNTYRVRDSVAAREKLAHSTSITAEKSGMISISVTDRDRTRAAQIANAYIDHLRSLTKTLAVTEASQRRLFYEEQLRKAKEDLVTAEYQLRQVQLRKGVIQPDAQGRAVIEEMAQLDAQIAAKQVELQAQRSFATDRNPDVQLLKSQLESMRNARARMERGSTGTTDPPMMMRDLGGAGLDYLNAAHELQYRQTLFDLLVKQFDSARLDESKDPIIIQIVDLPVSPERRSFPRRSLITILFTMLGILAACSYLFIEEILRSNPRLSGALVAFRSALMSR